MRTATAQLNIPNSESSDYVMRWGLIPHECTPTHIQIIGGIFLVNFYPTTGSIYVDGMHKGLSTGRGDLREAVQSAFMAPPLLRQNHPYRTDRKTTSAGRTHKAALWDRSPTCVWCGVEFLAEQYDEPPGEVRPWRHTRYNMTLEHVIPLARGGSYSMGNTALACRDCNARHSDGEYLRIPAKMRRWWDWKARTMPSRRHIEPLMVAVDKWPDKVHDEFLI